MDNKSQLWIQQAIERSENTQDKLAADYYKNLAAARNRSIERSRQKQIQQLRASLNNSSRQDCEQTEIQEPLFITGHTSIQRASPGATP